MTAVTGSFSATGRSTAFAPSRGPDFNFAIGTPGSVLNATVRLERSFDGGSTWSPVTYPDGTLLSWTSGVNSSWSDAEIGVLYSLNCSAYTSGTIAYRVS